MLDGISHDSDELLTGKKPQADAKLIADINAAPDPFDGGCPADVEATPAPIIDAGPVERAYTIGRKRGIKDAVRWLRDHERTQTAAYLCDHYEEIVQNIVAGRYEQ